MGSFEEGEGEVSPATKLLVREWRLSNRGIVVLLSRSLLLRETWKGVVVLNFWTRRLRFAWGRPLLSGFDEFLRRYAGLGCEIIKFGVDRV